MRMHAQLPGLDIKRWHWLVRIHPDALLPENTGTAGHSFSHDHGDEVPRLNGALSKRGPAAA